MRPPACDIVEIYEAVGDPKRWEAVNRRMAHETSPDLAQHLGIARRVHERLVDAIHEVETLAGVYAQAAVGSLVLNEEARVIRPDAAAARMLADCGLTVVQDRLQMSHGAPRHALLEAVARAAAARDDNDAGSATYTVLERRGQTPLLVVILRAPTPPGRLIDHRIEIVLLVFDPDMTIPHGAALREVFGLTPRESQMVILILQGKSVREAARSLGVTVNTARTFLAQARAKTGSSTQAELLRRLLTIPHNAMAATSSGKR